MGWIAEHATSEPVTVLDLGGRDINGSPRRLFPAATRYTVLDIRPGDGVLIVTTAAPGRPPHSAVDGEFRLLDGEHYANIRPAELERVLAGAGWADVVVDVQPSPADVRAVAAKRKEAP
jgi:hypothetical protein